MNKIVKKVFTYCLCVITIMICCSMTINASPSFDTLYKVSADVLEKLENGEDINKYVSSGRATQVYIKNDSMADIGISTSKPWNWGTVDSSGESNGLKVYLYGVNGGKAQYGVVWETKDSIEVCMVDDIKSLNYFNNTNTNDTGYLNTLGKKPLKDYTGTIIETDFANIVSGNAYYTEGSKLNVVRDGIKYQGTSDVSEYYNDWIVKGSSQNENSVVLEYDGRVLKASEFFGAGVTYADKWQTADKSEGASKILYIRAVIPHQRSSREDLRIYGVMWESDGVVCTYMTMNYKYLTGLVDAIKQGDNVNFGGAAGANNYEEYDVSNDADMGGKQEGVGDLSLREIGDDTATLNRLEQIRLELEERKKQEKSNLFDIVLKISGIIVIFYTVLLAIAYVLDLTNTVIDIELVRILTFNRAVCVRDSEDLKMLESNQSTQFLMTKKRFIIYTLIGIISGVVLMNANFLRYFAETIYTVITG